MNLYVYFLDQVKLYELGVSANKFISYFSDTIKVDISFLKRSYLLKTAGLRLFNYDHTFNQIQNVKYS